MSWVFANDPGDRGSNPGQVIPKTQKMVLDATLLNTQHYKLWIKGKVERSRQGVTPSPTPWCSSYWKGSLRVAFDYGHQLYFYFIYVYIYTHTHTHTHTHTFSYVCLFKNHRTFLFYDPMFFLKFSCLFLCIRVKLIDKLPEVLFPSAFDNNDWWSPRGIFCFVF